MLQKTDLELKLNGRTKTQIITEIVQAIFLLGDTIPLRNQKILKAKYIEILIRL